MDEPFAECKGWAITGLPPPPEISEDGIVGVAGMAWHPETDYIELKKLSGEGSPQDSGVQGWFLCYGELCPPEID